MSGSIFDRKLKRPNCYLVIHAVSFQIRIQVKIVGQDVRGFLEKTKQISLNVKSFFFWVMVCNIFGHGVS